MSVARADPESIAEAVRRLHAGEAVAFPTETVYGLGADATNERAIARVFELKGRPSNNPLIVHVSGAQMASRVVSEWTEHANKIADEFWPGPVSLVLPKSDLVPDLVTAGGPTVAVRMPNHPIALALLEAFGGPLVGPSANRSGSVSPTTADHVRESWSADELYVIDGGACRVGIESTVLSLPLLNSDPPRVLRPGAISAEQLADCLGTQVIPYEPDQVRDPGAPPASPGVLHTHYQPNARVVVNPADAHEGERVIELPSDANAAAETLYASLRAADARRPSRIVVRVDPSARGSSPLWDAVFDRLDRASSSE